MKKVLLILSVFIVLSGCATVPKPSENSQSSSVTFCISGNDLSALTFWRKINDDGSKGKRFSVGGASRFALFMNFGFTKPFEEIINLETGTYYLDSFQINTENGFIISQGKRYNFRNGWDDANNKPLYFSFTVEKEKDLILPKIEIIPLKEENGYAIIKLKLDGGDISTLIFGDLVQVETAATDSEE